ncbi:MAG: amidase domain-containing protein [Acetobacterium sp.]
MTARKKGILKKKRKETIFVLVIILTIFMVLVLWFRNYSTPPKMIDTSNEEVVVQEEGNNAREIMIRSGEETIETAIFAPILDYFKVSTNALADLQSADLTGLFEDGASQNAQINQGALNYLISLRSNQSNDLHIKNYLVGLSVTENNESDGLFEVTVEEDQTVNFAFIPDVNSSSSGIKHTFLLVKGAQGYVIAEHNKEEDVFSVITAMVEENGYSQELIDELLEEESSVINGLAQQKEQYNSAEKIITETATNPYNSMAAINYANTWVDPVMVIRNEEDFAIYDGYGGNCNNFISQCLNAGGIPMDTIGDAVTQWKWYGETVNPYQGSSGRSPSWAGVQEFYNYASENSGYGLAAVVGDNIYSGSPGDILQYAISGEWVHSVIITDVVKDREGQVLDYLINSNTTDRINYPASAYGYTDLRLIKIRGWNEE